MARSTSPTTSKRGSRKCGRRPEALPTCRAACSVRLPDQTLPPLRMTGAAGPEIYRGDRLPADLVGDLFFGEPIGRIVRRAKVVETDGMTQLRNAHPKSEFMRSTDPLFRPVNVANAPDGTLSRDRHVHGDHPGGELHRVRVVPATQDRTVLRSTRSTTSAPHLAHLLHGTERQTGRRPRMYAEYAGAAWWPT